MVTNKDTLSNNKIENNKKFKEIIKKVKDNNLIINKAEKGNILTIENKSEFNNKTTNFLNPSVLAWVTPVNQHFSNFYCTFMKDSRKL